MKYNYLFFISKKIIKLEEWNTPYLKLDLIKKEIQFTAN